MPSNRTILELRGHFWTLAPFVRDHLVPPSVPDWVAWETNVEDPKIGTLRLNGQLALGHTTNTVLVLVHGLGGSSQSYYAIRAARAAERAGLASLRFDLRGADRLGADYYHAGLTADLDAALRSDALTRFEHILLLGYSLGGNMMLRYLAEDPDRRVRAAASICAPLDLAKSARRIDRPRGAPYRRHILRALKEIYHRVAERRAVPLPLVDALRIDSFERWDDEVIAPRYGFDGAEDYWAKTSAGYVLDRIRTPTLFVASENDPMVGIETVRPMLENTSTLRRVITDQGGHVGFPPKLDLGLGAQGTVEEQVIQWLLART